MFGFYGAVASFDCFTGRLVLVSLFCGLILIGFVGFVFGCWCCGVVLVVAVCMVLLVWCCWFDSVVGLVGCGCAGAGLVCFCGVVLCCLFVMLCCACRGCVGYLLLI